MDDKAHWEKIYRSHAAQDLSWYRERLDFSLALIEAAHPAHDAAIIDIGGGASTLMDDLLQIGFKNVAVLDLSGTALEKAKERLGALSERVRWIESDVTTSDFAADSHDLWHDRAVFHFLTDAQRRAAYVTAATRAIKKGGFLVIATFAAEGPTKCSGLAVERYGPRGLAEQFPGFTLLESNAERHPTPAGAMQDFTWILMQKRDPAN